MGQSLTLCASIQNRQNSPRTPEVGPDRIPRSPSFGGQLHEYPACADRRIHRWEEYRDTGNGADQVRFLRAPAARLTRKAYWYNRNQLTHLATQMQQCLMDLSCAGCKRERRFRNEGIVQGWVLDAYELHTWIHNRTADPTEIFDADDCFCTGPRTRLLALGMAKRTSVFNIGLRVLTLTCTYQKYGKRVHARRLECDGKAWALEKYSSLRTRTCYMESFVSYERLRNHARFIRKKAIKRSCSAPFEPPPQAFLSPSPCPSSF